MPLRRIVLVRHGETEGNSSVRFHGRTDVALSEEGTGQMKAAARQLGSEPFDLVVASPLHRSWQAAWIVGHGAQIRIESELIEIDFGRWEGLTKEEIQASDPVLFEEWQSRSDDFEFPNGESRSDFKARVEAVLERLLAGPENSALFVVHKGVIRVAYEKLTGEKLDAEAPELGAVLELTESGGNWTAGRKSSDPPGLAAA